MRGKRVGFLKAVTLAASGFAVVAVAVPAEASVCSRLQQQYLSASGGSSGGSSAKARNQLASALAEAKRKNCRRLGIFAKPARDCPQVMRKIGRLQSQVGRASFSSGPSQRDKIRSQLRRNGCAVPGGRGGSDGVRIVSSGYRTLCVRTCDGYYFPVNFRSSTSRFKVDEAVCKSMYGGAGAELFYHANGASAEEAIAVNGRRRLASEPYAFAYRTTFKPSCQSELKTGLANLEKIYEKRIAAEGTKKKGPGGVIQPMALPIPVARVARGEDPETVANRAGGFEVAPVEPMDLEEVVVATTQIRRLGPDYYYIAPQTIEALYEPPDLGPEFSLISAAQAADGPHDDADQPGSTVVR